ncbi:origin recognition complex subunit 4 [[Candida] anglica]|uniref:Origin recognition complex subunit 4 n=1 Tax=[Candida] anglica TaxID=148631 RepID=A0ABP0EH04_9ASCO
MSNSIEEDFEGEFEPIQKLSFEEAKSDRMLREIKLRRKLQEDEKKHIDNKEPNQPAIEKEKEPVKRAAYITSQPPKKRTQTLNLKKIKLFNSKSGSNPYNIQLDDDPVEIDTPPVKKPKLSKALELMAQFTKNTSTSIVEDSFSASPDDIACVRNTILSQLAAKGASFPHLLESSIADKYMEVYRMFEHTVRDNEGHSALIIGPRSSGKTAIIQRALSELSKKYPQDFITISLHAYHQNDENTALREIARQLDKSLKKLRQNEEEINHNTNELKNDKDDSINENQLHATFEQRSLSDTFSNILSILDKGKTDSENTHTVSIIFIIEEFEKFTQSGKQTLLYNLFDLSQNSSTPVCVCGTSTKLTTRELLEKRVRSRFSQRIITINKPKGIDEFWSNAKLGLTLGQDVINKLSDPSYGKKWNDYVESAYSQSQSFLKRLVVQNYYTSKNYRDFNNSVRFAIAQLGPSNVFPRDNDFATYLRNQSINNIQSKAGSLSELELLLVIAAARWVEKYALSVVNFNLAYKEYEEMMKQYNIGATTAGGSASAADSAMMTNFKVTQRIWPPNILKNSWENLYRLDLLLDATAAAIISEKGIVYNAGVIEESRMVQLDITLEELGHLVDESSFVKKLTRL